jgi:acyl-homoserine lactone acylase PvdQ
MKGLNAQVTIVFDQKLIPYIFAGNDHDAAVALGYLHATYRLWQMDAQRRLAEGRLSEVLGNSTLQQDEYMRVSQGQPKTRQLGFRRIPRTPIHFLTRIRRELIR